MRSPRSVVLGRIKVTLQVWTRVGAFAAMAMVHGWASGNREKWLEPVALVATICHQPAVLQCNNTVAELATFGRHLGWEI